MPALSSRALPFVDHGVESRCSSDCITALLQKRWAVAVANKPGEFIRRGLISGVEKIEPPRGMPKSRELLNEGEVGLRLDKFTALLLQEVASP